MKNLTLRLGGAKVHNLFYGKNLITQPDVYLMNVTFLYLGGVSKVF